MIVLKKVVQSGQTQRELLHLLQSPLVPQQLDRSNFQTTQLPPLGFTPLTTSFTDLAANRLYANNSHLLSSIATAANLAEHEPSWNAAAATRQFGIDTSTVYRSSTTTAQPPFLTAVATSPPAVLHNRSLGAVSLSHSLPPSSMESPLFASPLLQQRLTKPNNTSVPLFQNDVHGRNCSTSGNSISHRDLSFHPVHVVNEASLLPHFFPTAIEQRSSKSLMDHTTTTNKLSSDVLQLYLLQQLQEIKQRRRV